MGCFFAYLQGRGVLLRIVKDYSKYRGFFMFSRCFCFGGGGGTDSPDGVSSAREEESCAVFLGEEPAVSSSEEHSTAVVHAPWAGEGPLKGTVQESVDLDHGPVPTTLEISTQLGGCGSVAFSCPVGSIGHGPDPGPEVFSKLVISVPLDVPRPRCEHVRVVHPVRGVVDE